MCRVMKIFFDSLCNFLQFYISTHLFADSQSFYHFLFDLILYFYFQYQYLNLQSLHVTDS